MKTKYLYPLIYIIIVVLTGPVLNTILVKVLFKDGYLERNYLTIMIVSRLLNLVAPFITLWLLSKLMKPYRLIKASIILSIINAVIYFGYFVIGYLVVNELHWMPLLNVMIFIIVAVGVAGIAIPITITLQRSYPLGVRVGYAVMLVPVLLSFLFFNQAIIYITDGRMLSMLSVQVISIITGMFSFIRIVAFTYILYALFDEQEKNEPGETIEFFE